MKIFQRQTQPPIGKPQPARKPKPDGENRSGLMALFAVLLVVSALSGLRFDRPMKVFVAGEIATQDVTADQDLLVEDVESTHSKREQVAQAQPPVFDLSAVAAEHLERELAELFSLMNATDEKSADELTMQLEDRLNAEVRSFTLSIWRSEEFQNIVLGPVLPWLKDYLAKGVSAEKRALLTYKNGIVLRDLASGREQLVTGLTEVKDKTDLFADLEVLLQRDLKAPLRIRKALESLLAPILSPSLTLNQETTQARKREVMAAVEPVYYQIKKGEIIVRQGGRVGPDQQIKMQALYTQRPSYFDLATSSGVLIIGTLLVLGMYLAYWHTFSRVNSDRDGSMLALVLLLFTLGAKILAVLRGPLADALVFVHIPPELFAFLMPVAGAMGVLALFFSYIVCFFACLLLAFACTAMVGGGLDLFTYYFLGGLFYTFFIKRSQSRSEMLATIFPLLGANLLTFAGVGLIHYHSLAALGEGLAAAALNAALSLLTVFGFSPIVEMLFGYTSRFRLMELMNLEQPLLQELMVNAPGTYHHALVVSNMVEAAARAIGANALLAKVAALYHDIGKLKNPNYFIENQFGGANKHDKLTPSMSALILTSHVKKGSELAREHKLGPELSDLIQQHHGTTLISFFYNKAQEQAEAKGDGEIREEDYRYPGPKPQTKEAGLILLADVIEASSRTLIDPTPSRIKGHIQKHIRTIFNEGQLDESELTLKDLHLVSDAFQRILTGIFHQRIEYPEQKLDEAKLAGLKSAKPAETEAKPKPARPEPLAGSLKVVK